MEYSTNITGVRGDGELEYCTDRFMDGCNFDAAVRDFFCMDYFTYRDEFTGRVALFEGDELIVAFHYVDGHIVSIY